MTIFVLCFIVIIYFINNRYFPIAGLKQINKKELELSSFDVVDVRDYNESNNSPVEGATNVPVAYLNRYYSEIPKNDLIVVASNHLEKNIGIRLLRKKGLKVAGYLISDHKQKVLNE